MPRTIICTAGVSIAQGCSSLRKYQERHSDWDEDTSELGKEIDERLAGFDLATEEGRIKASAEINSLHRLGCAADDEVVLLATDTADGHACGSALAKALRRALGVESAQLVRVEGLQVRDGTRLKKVGIPRLIEELTRYLADHQRRYGAGVVLNPTGGFKGVVPFMTVLGMLHRAKVVYVFEFSEQLITLPPLPVSHDLDLFERARPALEWARGQAVFAPGSFYHFVSDMEPGEEDLFAGYLEVESPHAATLSPLAMALLEEESRAADHLMLSPEAREFFAALPPDERGRYERKAGRLASPLHRSKHRKSFTGTDLEVYCREHDSARFAGFTQEDVFHLCLVSKTQKHVEYVKLFSGKRRSDFRDFVLWAPPADALLPEEEDGEWVETWGELRQQRDQLREECESLRREGRQQKREYGQTIRTYRESEQALRRADQQARAELEEARRRIQALERKLAAPARPAKSAQEDEETARSLLGTVVNGVFKGFQGKTWRFTLEVGGKTWEICLPQAALEYSLPKGQVLSIQLQAFNGTSFEGKPAS